MPKIISNYEQQNIKLNLVFSYL